MNESQQRQIDPKIARDIRLLALDVDGVLSDGKLFFDDTGREFKAFNVRDGLGIKLLQSVGIEIAIITGRDSPIVVRRADELGIRHLIPGRDDKLTALQELCIALPLPLSAVAYMGDDLPDMSAVGAAGLGLSVADAHPEVRDVADFVTLHDGGMGAVREACEAILQARGDWDELIERYR